MPGRAAFVFWTTVKLIGFAGPLVAVGRLEGTIAAIVVLWLRGL